MPNSSITITFSSLALTGLNLEGMFAKFNYNHNTSIDIIENFLPLRINPYESRLNGGNIVLNYSNAIAGDYPGLMVSLVSGDSVTFTSAFSGTIFTRINDDDEYLTYGINNEDIPVDLNPITVLGIESDRYLINNPIIVNVSSLIVPIYYKVVISNLTNQKVSTNLISYPDILGSSKIGLDSVIKSLFEYPSDANGYLISNQIVPNSNLYKISIYYNYIDSLTSLPTGDILGYEVVKTFIRGGKRTAISNQSISGLSILTLTENLPIWGGFDTAEYYLDSQNLIRKRLLMEVPTDSKINLRTKGCNEIYVKFLNQNGGYSNWLFESHVDNENNDNIGGFIKNNLPSDLGNEVQNKIICNSKVPKYFIKIINDLIVSPEIYIFINGSYDRVRSSNNSVSYDNVKRSYNVNINFELDYRFNPSLLWSN